MVLFILTPGESHAAHSWLLACHTFRSLQLLLVFPNQANDKQLQVAKTLRSRAASPSRSKSASITALFHKNQHSAGEVSKYPVKKVMESTLMIPNTKAYYKCWYVFKDISKSKNIKEFCKRKIDLLNKCLVFFFNSGSNHVLYVMRIVYLTCCLWSRGKENSISEEKPHNL